MTATTYSSEVVCVPRSGTLYETLELILDRGLVIDVFLRVSLVGIEILQVDARIVVASVDTYLRFAEACNRLDLEHDTRSTTVPEMFGTTAGAVGKRKVKKAAESVGDRVRGMVRGPEEAEETEDAEEDVEARPRRRAPSAESGRARRRASKD